MRHYSERVKGKNYRNFAGRPLYHHIVESLLKCPAIHQIAIDTDSPIILDDARSNFPSVILVERPEHLRDGSIPMNEIIKHDLSVVPSVFYLQTHATNPLLKTETIQRAIHIFKNQLDQFDSLFSVTRLQTRLWDMKAKPINHTPSVLLRTQDLPPVFEENSCLYIFERNNFLSSHNRIGKAPYLFEIARLEAVDIDEEFDFQFAEYLYLHNIGEPS